MTGNRYSVWFLFCAILIPLVAACSSPLGDFDKSGLGLNRRAIGDSLTVQLSETAEAFRNPLKGFRPSRYIQDAGFKDYEYTSVYKQYIRYSDLESSSSDNVQKIIDWSNANWAGLPAKNLKVIPRVVILYPGTGEFWGDIPHDGTPNQWYTQALKNRLTTFVAKLGQAWDNDPRVAAVEVGLWGKWGEHNIWPDNVGGSDRIPGEFQQALGDAYTQAFHNKRLMVRYPETFTNYTIGFIWDSFALPDDDNAMGGAGILARNTWATQMQSGEVAYDWGNQTNLGGSPNGTLSSVSNTNYVIDYIKRMHTSSLGWIAEYDPSVAGVAANATAMQKAFGYRYVLTQATFTSAAAQGGSLNISFKVTNKGSAPMYYNWPVEASLLRADKSVAWKGNFNTDIRQWMPDNSYTVSGSFVLPANLATGTYTLALAVLDPAGNNPSLRFANTNYYTGGRTPLGKVGIGQDPSDQNLGSFNSLKTDNTLFYTVGGSNPSPAPSQTPAPSQAPSPSVAPSVAPSPSPSAAPSSNLALGKTVSVSSTEAGNGGVNVAPNAVDGSLSTRWSSEWGIDPSWISVDLGAVYTVNRVKLTWEWSYAKSYQIQISANGSTWSTVASGSNAFSGDKGINDVSFAAVSARYVKLIGIERTNQYGYSLYEFEVYGSGGSQPSPSPSAAPSPVPSPSPSAAPSPSPGTSLLLDNFDGNPAWPAGAANDLGRWTGANSFVNGAGTVNAGALVLQYNNAGWFGSDVVQSISQYTKMIVRIKGAVGGEETQFHMQFGGVDKTFAAFSSNTISTSYKDILIDLVSNGVNRASPGQLNFMFWYGGSGTVSIDEIRFQ